MMRICLFLLCCLVTSGTEAQERRLALVVGINAYRYNDPLRNAIADAGIVAKALSRAGFAVIPKEDINRLEFESALAEFEKQISPNDVALIYFSGHAIQSSNRNILLTADSDVSSGVAFRRLIDATEAAKFRIIILDACRLNSAALKSAIPRGLKPEYPRGDTAIIFSAEAGTEASDGTGENSPFAASLVRHLSDGLELVPMMRLVTQDVRAATSGLPPENQQSPEIRVGGATAFYFGASFSIQPGIGEPARLIARELQAQFERAGFVLDPKRPSIVYDVDVESRTIGRSLDGPDRVIVTITKRWTDPALRLSAPPVRAEYAWRNPNSSARNAAEQLYSLLLPSMRSAAVP
jgi:Caspase domain